MTRYIKSILFIVFTASLLIGCHTQTPEPTASSTMTKTPLPTATFKPIPTSTLTPTLTPTSTATLTPTPTLSPTPSCHADQVLKSLKADFPYDEFAIGYNTIQDIEALAVWVVDPELNPLAKGEDIKLNLFLAMRHAALLSLELNESNACIEEIFPYISIIVVDANHNGWFSGQVSSTDLPKTKDPTEVELDDIVNAFQVAYNRIHPTNPVQAPPNDSCSWSEARENIQRHFSPDRENVNFYFVIDEAGRNVWAQWDGPTDYRVIASILNVTMELHCLHPAPTQLFALVVDETGEVGLIVLADEDAITSMDINEFQILYEK